MWEGQKVKMEFKQMAAIKNGIFSKKKSEADLHGQELNRNK
jgi:hypothetical protein